MWLSGAAHSQDWPQTSDLEIRNQSIGRRLDPNLVQGSGGVVVRLLASHLGEGGSILGGLAPGFSQVGIVPDGAVSRRVFSRISRFLRPCIPMLLYSHLFSPSSALKASIYHIKNYKKTPVFPNTFIDFPRKKCRTGGRKQNDAYPAEGTRSSAWRVVPCAFDPSLVAPCGLNAITSAACSLPCPPPPALRRAASRRLEIRLRELNPCSPLCVAHRFAGPIYPGARRLDPWGEEFLSNIKRKVVRRESPATSASVVQQARESSPLHPHHLVFCFDHLPWKEGVCKYIMKQVTLVKAVYDKASCGGALFTLLASPPRRTGIDSCWGRLEFRIQEIWPTGQLGRSRFPRPCTIDARPRSRSEGAIRANLTRTTSASSLLRARRAKLNRSRATADEGLPPLTNPRWNLEKKTRLRTGKTWAGRDKTSARWETPGSWLAWSSNFAAAKTRKLGREPRKSWHKKRGGEWREKNERWCDGSSKERGAERATRQFVWIYRCHRDMKHPRVELPAGASGIGAQEPAAAILLRHPTAILDVIILLPLIRVAFDLGLDLEDL
ncbi:hypothetical protein PR048_006984 [Dryococelus australis]|uniref:Uncharacterized protein n=1 Tax=Dryococelus australis TaxID=614101 RepID=A0ABQ9IDS2_9NEOP|nr:hypothetical protein PR048_006984 [Dryococelus australis]